MLFVPALIAVGAKSTSVAVAKVVATAIAGAIILKKTNKKKGGI